MQKDFDTWNTFKKRLQYSTKNTPYFYEREVWWCALGVNIGHEQDGRQGNFERPVVILKKFNKHVFLGLPVTTKSHNKQYYIPLSVYNDIESFVIISQIRLLSSKRLLRRVRKLPSAE